MASAPLDFRIVEAANLANLNAIAKLIEEGVDVSVQEDWALRCAARVGSLKSVELLVKAGATPEAKDSLAAKWATLEGHTDIMRWLYEHGCQLKLAWLAEATKESAWRESVIDLLFALGVTSMTPTEASAICIQALETKQKGMYLLLWHRGIRASPTEIAGQIIDRCLNPYKSGIFDFLRAAPFANELLKFHSEDEQSLILEAIAKSSQEMSELLGDKISSSHIAAGAWATSLIHNRPVDWSPAIKRLDEEHEEWIQKSSY
jgi:hypothetical protein